MNLYDHGKAVYQSVCTTCHNSDPAKVGGVGPDVAGSSMEVLRAKVLWGAYPLGYKPKRKTHIMPMMHNLSKEIEAIHAYLNKIKSK